MVSDFKAKLCGKTSKYTLKLGLLWRIPISDVRKVEHSAPSSTNDYYPNVSSSNAYSAALKVELLKQSPRPQSMLSLCRAPRLCSPNYQEHEHRSEAGEQRKKKQIFLNWISLDFYYWYCDYLNWVVTEWKLATKNIFFGGVSFN